MHHFTGHGDDWSWAWMIPMMLLFLAALGGVIYAAVRMALQHSQRHPFDR